MEIKELLEKQKQTGYIILIRQGLFLRGYNSGALMLEKLLGYKVKRIYLKSYGKDICAAGFPSGQLDRVVKMVEQYQGKIISRSENIIEIAGLDFPFTEEMTGKYDPVEKKSDKKEKNSVEKVDSGMILIKKVLSYNLSTATPLEVMLFLNEIQKEFRELKN